MSGIGPGTGVADAGATVCCATAADRPAAMTMAATQTLCINVLVSIMTSPPCALVNEGVLIRPLDAALLLGVVRRIFSWLDRDFGGPDADLATRMRADRRIGDHAVGRALAGHAGERRGVEPDQQHLVEARAFAH